jgi:hypothetical protein
LRYSFDEKELSEKNLNIIFTSSKKIKKHIWPKNKLFVCPILEAIEGPSVLKCDFMSIQEIEGMITKIIDSERNYFLNLKLKESEKSLEEIKSKNDLISEVEILQNLKEFENIIELEIEILKKENFSDWNVVFKNYIKKVNWLSQLCIFHLNEVLNEDLILDENTLLFKLPFDDYFLFFKTKNILISECGINIELLLNTVLKSIQLIDQNLIRADEEIDFWKRIFAKIPYPMAVITKLGDLLIYNELFAKIGILPKECLTYKDQESIEILQQFFVVKRIEIDILDQKVFYFIFYTSEKVHLNTKNKKSGIDDLGIVSSSIAHELNNPLAGILAALSLLLLEEDLTNEALSEIEEMKSGARRCKELVEIFLGFSRFSPKQKNNISLKDSLNQAINLLRFRMVESNLRIDMRYSPTLEQFVGSINSSILSMILYLIISELLTSFAHHRLITNKNMNVITGEIVEFSNQIVIRIDDEFEYEDKLAQSKLIQHLLVFEKMEIKFLRNEIRLVCRS